MLPLACLCNLKNGKTFLFAWRRLQSSASQTWAIIEASAYSAPDHVLGSPQNTAEYSQNVKSCQVAGLDGEGTILATIAFDSSFGCPRLPETLGGPPTQSFRQSRWTRSVCLSSKVNCASPRATARALGLPWPENWPTTGLPRLTVLNFPWWSCSIH